MRLSRPAFSRLAVALAAVVANANAEGPAAAPAMAAAQLAAMPTSPSFKMEVHKADTGALPAAPVARAELHGEPPAVSKTEPKAEPKSDSHGEPTVAAVSARAPASAAAKGDNPPADSMERLRQRLAEKLGAKPAESGKFVMRVSNRGESGDNVISAARPTRVAIVDPHRPGARSAVTDAGPAREDPHAGTSLVPTHWDYAGAGGPDAWGKLQPGFDKCATGTRQSPIDIQGGIAVDLEPIQFDYRAGGFSVIDNGHTVQVNVAPGNSITITGRRYDLVQFHFHRPSEERIDGRQFDMVAHLVHKDVDGRLAVVAVLLDRGSAQPLVQTVWNNLPLEKGEEVRAGASIDPSTLLPQDRRYYTYMGSLTTPPCSEGVLWMVMKQPVPISPDQLAIFSHLYPMNARPIQQASGRLIKQSN